MPKSALRCLISAPCWFPFLASPALGAALKTPSFSVGLLAFHRVRVPYYGVTYFLPACGASLVCEINPGSPQPG